MSKQKSDFRQMVHQISDDVDGLISQVQAVEEYLYHSGYACCSRMKDALLLAKSIWINMEFVDPEN